MRLSFKHQKSQQTPCLHSKIYFLGGLQQPKKPKQANLWKTTSINLWNGQPLGFVMPVLWVGADVCVRGEAVSVHRLQVDLGAEEVADSLQGAAGVGGQGGVRQQVWDQAVGLSHHRNVHHHTGAWQLGDKIRRKIRNGWEAFFVLQRKHYASVRNTKFSELLKKQQFTLTSFFLHCFTFASDSFSATFCPVGSILRH